MASFRQVEDQGQFILYDPEHIPQIHADWFTLEYWQEQKSILGGAPGRGTSVFLETPAGEAVWRHYHRGGLPGKFIKDLYLWQGLEASRSWREMHLTQQLYDLDLPVPKPLAAGVKRQGLTYRADLITARIPGVLPLADYLPGASEELQKQALQAAARVINPFHQEGLNHTDLNPRNILIHPESLDVWLIDFDRCLLLQPDTSIATDNLFRLHRAFVKLDKQKANTWQTWLLKGYQAG
jgi:3-deoxy-D-manno-octulosonic acid kinase